ncbi:tautomerase family protein [Methylobacterium sp. J-030]|uniref:tautomerase family protein n=1 Tax=Methylobacterium sp. J-030 TaxID=2836627 RepID=UPI001FB8DFEE|nr:tautomerase family protein [Methylobacterium sp. J-030]MCJ2069798.1 tautomerase family protein [Methylobacterium sp. J-030]
MAAGIAIGRRQGAERVGGRPAQGACLQHGVGKREFGQDPGVKPGNVFVSLVEVAPENWSVGDGLVQYGPPV